MIYLKQSTASQEVPLGYFVDSTDGNTEETGLTIANTDIKIWKTGATTLSDKNSGGATHISNGIYYAVLDATDTNTLGPLVIFCHVAGALSVRVECCVLAANVYDSIVAASDKLQVHTDEMTNGVITASVLASDAITAAKVAADVTTEIQSGLATASALSTVEGKIDTIDSNVDAILVDTGTTLDGKLNTIDDFLDTEVAAIKAKTDNLPASPAATGDIPSAATIADAVWDEAQSGHTTAGTFGKYLDSEVSGVSGGGGSAPTASEIADAVWDEATTGHTTSGTFGEQLKTDVDAIKAKTDNLPASPAATGDIPSAASIRSEIDSNSTKLDAAISTRATPAQVNAEVIDVLSTDTHAELSAIPGDTPTLKQMIQFLFQYWKNKRTTTSTTEILYKADSSTSLGTSTVSDDGTTATHGKVS